VRCLRLALAVLVLAAGLIPAAADARRGGTLRVDLQSDFDFVDPALAYFNSPWQQKFMTECKLLNFPDRDGAAGNRPVREVAASISAAPNKKTYTIRIRPGWRFSNGRPVTAANFKFAIDALDRPNAYGSWLVDDFSRVTASGSTLEIRLTRPAGDMPGRLASSFFAPLPSATPPDFSGPSATWPSCGAYYVGSWTDNQIQLDRNPFYIGTRQANPDRIVQYIGIALDAQRLRCERGESDVCGVAPSDAAAVRDRYGVNRGRFFVKGQAVFWYLNFNHDEPLFRGNNRLKQAVNLVLDRPQLANQHGALGGARTDQILPIDFPGFRNWNIYSLRGANTTRARQLASGNTRGGKVRFWTFDNSFGPAVAETVRFNLGQIGLETDITTFDSYRQMMQAADNRSTNEYDMLLNGWGADYPDPYDFINILLSGSSIQRDDNVNLSYFNEPVWNRRMNQAARTFGAQRLRTYAVLDRDLMRGPAPVAPYIRQNSRALVSDRVRDFVFHRVYGIDFGALSLTDTAVAPPPGDQPPPPPSDQPPPPPPTCEQPLQATTTMYFGQPHIQVFGSCANLMPSGLHHLRIDTPAGKKIFAFDARSPSCSPSPTAQEQYEYINCEVKADGRICVILQTQPDSVPGDVVGTSLQRQDNSVIESGNKVLPAGDQPACQTGS